MIAFLEEWDEPDARHGGDYIQFLKSLTTKEEFVMDEEDDYLDSNQFDDEPLEEYLESDIPGTFHFEILFMFY